MIVIVRAREELSLTTKYTHNKKVKLQLVDAVAAVVEFSSS